MSFSFGFSGDDIDVDGEEEVGIVTQRATALANLPALSVSKSHDVEEIVGRFLFREVGRKNHPICIFLGLIVALS